ncbi:cytochrome c maturation protein CcmE [Legionella waltersii]|uniref:Cytochrome c-type biogenesis protein CcmE n=1 Tax=Legionella waltersii TaxID=66969 RepID=A0A0W1ANF6_9GAMM|nr:cytochrome c maturation protein CcmE [Legionella waltersii]KTD82845.1 cytochrome c-type biogenesis protein CcmE [Legionella waltersii]SNV01734.1 cytochrome c-type biogenesis protein CcmE [Legionella waltersii]
MTSARQRKLLMLVFFLSIISITAALVLYALRQNISLFYTPSDAVDGKAPMNQLIRIGGMVEQNSILRAQEGLNVQFKITDFDKTIVVTFTGILPDLFREGQGIVAEGELIDKQHFKAKQVLAKHDANYMPPQVKSALAKKVNT